VLHEKTQISCLFILQKKAIRIVCGAAYIAHTAPLFSECHVLPLELLIVQAKLLFMHSVKFSYCPPSFRTVFTRLDIDNAHYDLRYPNEFSLPRARIELFKKIPMYTLPLEWNECGDLRFYTNPVMFKITLLETLFNRLYNESLLISE
jgi:hypothetical protein